MRPTDKAKTEERRQHIVRAAIACFNRAGLHGASMSQICKQAGLSPGHLYHYFDSREALVSAVFERDWKESQDYLTAVSEAENGLAIYLGLIKSKAHAEPVEGVANVAFILEVVAETGRNEALAAIQREHTRNFEKRLRHMVVAAQARGEVVEGATVEEVMFAVEALATVRTFWDANGRFGRPKYVKMARSFLKTLLVIPSR